MDALIGPFAVRRDGVQYYRRVARRGPERIPTRARGRCIAFLFVLNSGTTSRRTREGTRVARSNVTISRTLGRQRAPSLRGARVTQRGYQQAPGAPRFVGARATSWRSPRRTS